MIKKLLFLLFLLLGAYLLREAYYFLLVKNKLPTGTTIGQVEVAGLTLQEASEEVAQAYGQPIMLTSQTSGETVEVEPTRFGFELDLTTMMQEAEHLQKEQSVWINYISFVLRNPLRPLTVPLSADHDDALAERVLQLATELMVKPPKPPRLDPETLQFLPGQDGYEVDFAQTTARVVEALYRPTERSAELVAQPALAPVFDMPMLKQVLLDQLAANQSLLGSFYIKDLRTGEEISINGDLALSGMSTMKVAILLEVYRVVSGPLDFDQQKLVNETGIYSGNYSANLLLDVVAGQDNAYLGVDILTESLHRLGLINSFIVTPYEEPPRPGLQSKITPANSVPNLPTDPDPNMQTTANDMGTLFSMIYECAQGGGPLIALYPEQLPAEDCQALLDVLSLNVDGNLIRFGVPHEVKVSHKHGWASNTHGDAGIVFSPGGDYVLVEYLTQPDSDWLVADYSFPILREISRVVYNYFNEDAPYMGDALQEAERFDPDDPYFNQGVTATVTVTATEGITGTIVPAQEQE